MGCCRGLGRCLTFESTARRAGLGQRTGPPVINDAERGGPTCPPRSASQMTDALTRNRGMVGRTVARRWTDVAVRARGCLSRGRDAGLGGVQAGLEAGLELHEQIEHRLGLAL